MTRDLKTLGLDISNLVAKPDLHPDPHQVHCICCRTSFDAICEHQAFGCASNFDPTARQLHGSYGSALIDLETHFVSETVEMPDTYGLVCDSCIEAMLDRGQLTFLKSAAPGL